MPARRSRTASFLAAAGAAFAVSAMIGAAPAVADDLVCSDSEVAVDGACVAVVSNTDVTPPDVTPLDSSVNDVAPPLTKVLTSTASSLRPATTPAPTTAATTRPMVVAATGANPRRSLLSSRPAPKQDDGPMDTAP